MKDDKDKDQVPMAFPKPRVLEALIRGSDGSLVVDEISPKMREVLQANAEKILPILVGDLANRPAAVADQQREARLMEALVDRSDQFNLLQWIRSRLTRGRAAMEVRVAAVIRTIEAYNESGQLPDFDGSRQAQRPRPPAAVVPAPAKPRHLKVVDPE